ncbi:MAG: hypothetical protein R3C05_26305 [Pirellulaceae bacterium]
MAEYIRNQQEHHRKLSFKEEYLAILRRHNIDFDLRYVFESEHVGWATRPGSRSIG